MSSRKLKIVNVDTYDVDTIDSNSVASLNLKSARSSAASSPAASDGTPDRCTPSKRFFFQKELYDRNTGQLVSDDIRHAYKLLQHLMSPSIKKNNSCFMVELGAEEKASSFYKPGSQSLTLPQMKEMFEASQYTSLTDFVRDMRSMLERYIRYYGPQHSVAGHCEKLEGIMLQKIALLPRKFQEMCTVEKTHESTGRGTEESGEWAVRPVRRTVHNLSSTLIHQLEQEAKELEKEEKKRQILQREKDREALKHELACWESSLFGGDHLELMLSSWELPQIGLFLYLCQTPLNCGEITQCEVERMLLLCRESEAMGLTMTSLLSSPFQRQYLDRRPPMPYHVWTSKLSARLSTWYKTLQDADFNYDAAAANIGIEPLFWHVVGRLRNPLTSRQFHELTYLQRIWIVKSLCDFCMATQSSLREAIDSQSSDDTRPQVLGTDAAGYTYLDFPQFCGDNVRIYKTFSGRRPGRKRTNHAISSIVQKHSRRSATPIDVCSVQSTNSPSLSTSRASSPSTKPTIDASSARAQRLARRSAKFEDWRDFKKLKMTNPISTSPTHSSPISNHNQEQTADSPSHFSVEIDDAPGNDGSSDCVDNHIGEEVLFKTEQVEVTNHTSSGDGENEPPVTPCQDVKSEPEVGTHSEAHDTPTTELPFDVKAEIPSDAANEAEMCKVEALSADECNAVDALSSLHQTKVVEEMLVSEEATPDVLEPEEDLVTETSDLYTYRLVCQSVEELRELCDSFSDGHGREVELYEELEHLLKDLTPFETKLVQLHQKAKEKMKKEQDEYVETTDQSHAEVNGEWESDEEPGEHSADESEATVESEGLPSTRRSRSNGEVKPVGDAKEEKTKEFGMSVFGRRRKRRVIPNNVEQGVFAKKRAKKDTKANRSTSPVVSNTTTTTTTASTTTTATDMSSASTAATLAAATAVTPSLTKAETVKVPEGYVLVKINKQLFMVPKAQLPSLLTQTNTARVQVVNHEVKVVNPTAVKTIQALNSLPPTSTVNLTTGEYHGTHLPRAKPAADTHSLPRHPLFSKYPLTLSTATVSTTTSTPAHTPVSLTSAEGVKQKMSYMCTKTGALVEQTPGIGKLKVQTMVTKTPTAMSLIQAASGSTAPQVIYTSISDSTQSKLSTNRGVSAPTPNISSIPVTTPISISPTRLNLSTSLPTLSLCSRTTMVGPRAPPLPDSTMGGSRYTLQLPSATIQVPASAVRLIYNRPVMKAAEGGRLKPVSVSSSTTIVAASSVAASNVAANSLAAGVRRPASTQPMVQTSSASRPILGSNPPRKMAGSTAVVLRPFNAAGVSQASNIKAPVGGLILGSSQGIRLLQTGRVKPSTSGNVNSSPADVTSSPVALASTTGGATITLSPQFIRTTAKTQVIGNVSLVASPVKSGTPTTAPQSKSGRPQARQIIHLQAGPRGTARLVKAVRGTQPAVRYIMPRAGSGALQVQTVLGGHTLRPAPQGQLIHLTTARTNSTGRNQQFLTTNITPAAQISQTVNNPQHVLTSVSTPSHSSNVTLVLASTPNSKPNPESGAQARPAD